MKTNDFRRIFGVIDLRGGKAVHAIAGRRDEYRPVRLCRSSDRHFAALSQGQDGDAVALVDAFLEKGVGGTYIADLDSICERSQLSLPTISVLLERPGEFWIDLGISGECPEDIARITSLVRARRRFARGAEAVESCSHQKGNSRWPDPIWVVPTESIRDLSALSRWLASSPPKGQAEEEWGEHRDGPSEMLDGVSLKLAAGLDLRNGNVVSDCDELFDSAPLEAARRLVGLGFQRLCVIDVADVGTGVGARTEELCRQLRQAFPDLVIIGGGGGRGLTDFHLWWEAGCDAVLSATWLLRQIDGFSDEFSY